MGAGQAQLDDDGNTIVGVLPLTVYAIHIQLSWAYWVYVLVWTSLLDHRSI